MKTDIKNFRSFLKNENGNILIMTAFSLLFLFAVAGASIDFGTAYLIKNKSQQATDFAALSAALLPDGSGTPAQVQQNQEAAIARYYNLNFPDTYLGVARQTPTQNLSNPNQITVTSGEYQIPNNFIKNTDNNKIIFSQGTTVSTAISKSEQKYDVILTMDNSNSMKFTYSNTDSTIRIDALRTAAKLMSNILLNDPNVPKDFNRMAGNSWATVVLTTKGFTSTYLEYNGYIDSLFFKRLDGTTSTVGLAQARDVLAKQFRPDVVHALVLISDGMNNWHTPVNGGTCKAGQLECLNGKFADTVNNESIAICDEFRNMSPKTVVYTIAASDAANNLKATNFLKRCADGYPNNRNQFYFEAKSAEELKQVFVTIANSIKSIRITN